MKLHDSFSGQLFNGTESEHTYSSAELFWGLIATTCVSLWPKNCVETADVVSGCSDDPSKQLQEPLEFLCNIKSVSVTLLMVWATKAALCVLLVLMRRVKGFILVQFDHSLKDLGQRD